MISFSDEVDPLFKTPQLLDEETRGRAMRFAERELNLPAEKTPAVKKQ